MSLLSYPNLTEQIIVQSELLASALTGADLTTPVPSCPGWNVGQLVRHVDGGHRWAAELVRTRASAALDDVSLRDLSAFTDDDPGLLAPVLVEGAQKLAAALGEASPSEPVWTPTPHGDAMFYARRFTHETVVHRADAELALGLPFQLAPEVAADGIEEWLELGSLPFHFDIHPWMRELLAPERTIGLRADSGESWTVDLSGQVIDWHRGEVDSPVLVSGSLTELLLVIYKRRPPGTVAGDKGLLDFWLERVDFG